LKHLAFSYLLLISLVSYGQTPSKIDIDNFNFQYFEHLVKTGVDQVRKEHDLDPLVNDSILYIAANHHSNYLVGLRQLSHTEDDSVLTKTPQDRAEYFGSTNYRVGENILFTPYNRSVKGKGGDMFDTHTYQGLADAMVSAWVHSPGHFKNIITPEYELTGLAVSVDTQTGRVYACQKFAIADYQYAFEENKTMFPYSNYVPPELANSFEGIHRELLKDYPYDFKLKHDNPEDCIECDEMVKKQPFLTLRVERNKFILRVENSNYVKNIMDKRKDGFVVEIVTFDDYMCGNPAYYTKPSRRNGQTKLNGKLLHPVYKKDLEKGYRKRAKRKDVKFLSYIFKADSVAFFDRFGRYKLDRYNFQYFEISLGRVPRDISGIWAHNLVYLQENQICHIDYFTGYCGEIINEYQPAEFIPPSAEDHCVFFPEDKSLHFSIPFEQGKSEFTKEDIEPFIQSISNLSYDLDSVSIKAYSSIEGDSLINSSLQILRAQNIAKVLKENQDQNVPVTISTSTDWEGFYESISTNSKWKYLGKKNRQDILKELNKVGFDQIEPILKEERRGEIDLYCTIHVNDQNLEYFITKELNSINNVLDSLKQRNRSNLEMLEQFNFLYECIHSKVVQGKISSEYLAGVKMPTNYRDNHPLTQNYIMYGYEFKEAFKSNQEWQKNHSKDEDYIQSSCSEPTHMRPEFYYILIRNATEYYQETGTGDFEKLQNMLNMLDKMHNYYSKDSVAQVNIDRLNFNLNVLLLNSVFAAEPQKYSGNAIKSIAQLHQFYTKYNLMTENKSILLGKTAVHFKQIQTAYSLLEPYANEDSVLAYMLPLGYQHISSEGAATWYENVISKSEQMSDEIWCNMFFKECMIPFQAFDYEPLRDVFCEKCMDKSDFIKEILGKKEVKKVEDPND
jgi:uncharacterized protein YkwD